MAPNDSPNRRSSDTVVNLLSERIDSVVQSGEKTAKSLEQHVTECAKMQKWVLIGVAFVAGWLITHSPEAAKALTKFLAVFA